MKQNPWQKWFMAPLMSLLLVCLVSAAAFADPLVVRVQPSGDSFAKAYVITGEARTYYGNVEGGTGPYEYKWEFSNGGDTGFAGVGDARYISYDNKTFDSAGTQWARLTVRDSSDPQLTSSATINLQVLAASDDNLNRQKNSAVDRGLRYLYTQAMGTGNWGALYNTGMALVALENHGHNLQSPDTDIFKKSVQNGVTTLLNSARYYSVTNQRCIGNPEANDGDSDNDGMGVYFSGVGAWDEMYIDPIVILALVNSCDKATAQSYIASTTSGDVNGQTLWDIIVDAKDYLAWAQGDGSNGGTTQYFSALAYDGYGEIRYSGDTVTNVGGYIYLSDTSTLGFGGTFTINWGDGTSSDYPEQGTYNYGSYGYPAFNWYFNYAITHTYTASGTYPVVVSYTSNGNTVQVMSTNINMTAGSTSCGINDAPSGAGGWRYTSNYGGSSDNSVTQWPVLALAEAKKRWDIGVNPMVNTMLDYWLQYSQNANGGFGYTGPGDWITFAKTAAGTIMLNYLGVPVSDSRMTNAFSWLDSNWGSENYGNGYSYLYSMYAFYKGMKSLGKADLNGRNWEELYTANLVSTQQADNGWYDSAGWEDHNFATYSALAILAPEVASLPPVANAGGPYPDVNAGQNVALNGSGSYHQDPARSLVKWEWDFDATDGLWWDTKVAPAAGEGAVGMTANVSYPDAGMDKSYTVTLRVTDNTTPTPMTDTDTATIKVTSGNVAPVAVTNGPWSGLPGQAITFDGTGSYDPNAGAPLFDHIVSYEWDLDGDGLFNEANGDDGTPVVAGNYSKVTKTFPSPVSLPATLRVTDSFGKVGTSTATTNIISIAVVYGQQYQICYRVALNRFQERQGLKVTFKNQGNAAADNLKMTLTSLPSNLTIFNNKSFTMLGTLGAGESKSSACDATGKTADIEVIFDRRIKPTGEWRWRGEFDFNGGHYVVDNIPPLMP